MAIIKFETNVGKFYVHRFDDVEYVSPLDYLVKQYSQHIILSYIQSVEKCLGTFPKWLYDGLMRLLPYKVKKILVDDIMSTKPPLAFYDIINKQMRKREQEKDINLTTLSPEQILSVLIYAGSKGYTLSHYSYNESFDKKKNAYGSYIYKHKNGILISNLGNRTQKELNYLLEKQEVLTAFIMDKGNDWFCLIQRKKGVMGKEYGDFGGIPHLHFVSNAYGIRRDKIVCDIKNGKYPANAFHVKISNYL